VLNLFEELLIGCAAGGIGKPVALVVESGDCFRGLRRCLSVRMGSEAE
jgi:hypothetical protein